MTLSHILGAISGGPDLWGPADTCLYFYSVGILKYLGTDFTNNCDATILQDVREDNR